ncbi:hypothetical protein K1T71_003519 [Dendrolimus kikuchii]|uniref:Uncharacterized protein n=1 Tax=Dendrolimus kikuchii TaxID=765133 RepID=A0ACC1DCG1_9NEOP|nr:hypothetical protein K1T71_003519 [Dendrolimus kikuchii]
MAGTSLSDDGIIRELWMRRLPGEVQRILIAQRDLPLEKVAEIADAIVEAPSPSCSSSSFVHSHLHLHRHLPPNNRTPQTTRNPTQLGLVGQSRSSYHLFPARRLADDRVGLPRIVHICKFNQNTVKGHEFIASLK